MNENHVIEGVKRGLSKISRAQLITYGFIFLALGVSLINILNFFHFRNLLNEIVNLETNISALENKLSSTTNELSRNISQTHDTLSTALDQEKQNVGNIAQSLGTYRQEVGSYTNTVSNLQKLSKTDPQLLSKYSKVFFLNENYAPARLAEIPSDYKYSNNKALKLNAQVWPYLQKMLDGAKNASTTIYVYSAYRSFNEQRALKGQYTVVYGSGSANAFSADQGYSEHQLGTTIDLIVTGLGGELEGFDKTKAYTWLTNNAHLYGFILSYPKSNKFYVYEPWHWRFVGVKLAIDLHNKGINFYDMDQRDIDEYLVSLFD